MAITIPSFVIADSGGTGATSFTLAAPSGLGPADIDLVLAIYSDSAADRALSISNDDTAYAALAGGNLNQNGTNQADARVWWKAGAASPGVVTVTKSGADAWPYLGLRLRIAGVDIADPINASGQQSGNAAPSGAPWSIPGVTTTVDNALLLAWFAYAHPFVGGSEGARFAATGWVTAGLNHISNGTSGYPAGAAFSRIQATAGAAGTCDVVPVSSADATARNWLGGMIAFRPADGGAPPAIVRARSGPIMLP